MSSSLCTMEDETYETSNDSTIEELKKLREQCEKYEEEVRFLKSSNQEMESKLLELKFEIALTQAKEDTQRVETQRMTAERDLLLLETESERVAFREAIKSLENQRDELLRKLEKDPSDDTESEVKKHVKPSERRERRLFGNRRRRFGGERNQSKEVTVIPLHCIEDVY